MTTEHEDKLSWLTRLKLCFFVLFRGRKPDSEEFLTRRGVATKKRMDQMRKDLESTIRPRTEKETGNDFWD